jgi:hypothetical protein
MRRSPRQRYPYVPGDRDPFIHPLQGLGPQGGPPVYAGPPLPPQQDYYADIFAALQRLTSTIGADARVAPDLRRPIPHALTWGKDTPSLLGPEPAVWRPGNVDREILLNPIRTMEDRPGRWPQDPEAYVHLLSSAGSSNNHAGEPRVPIADAGVISTGGIRRDPAPDDFLDTLRYYAGPHLSQAVSNGVQLGRWLGGPLLEFLPGTGDALALRDTTESAREGTEAVHQGRYGDAALSFGLSGIDALGTLPVIPHIGGYIRRAKLFDPHATLPELEAIAREASESHPISPELTAHIRQGDMAILNEHVEGHPELQRNVDPRQATILDLVLGKNAVSKVNDENRLGLERHHLMTEKSRPQFLDLGFNDAMRDLATEHLDWRAHRGAGVGIHSLGYNRFVRNVVSMPDVSPEEVQRQIVDFYRQHGRLHAP